MKTYILPNTVEEFYNIDYQCDNYDAQELENMAIEDYFEVHQFWDSSQENDDHVYDDKLEEAGSDWLRLSDDVRWSQIKETYENNYTDDCLADDCKQTKKGK